VYTAAVSDRILLDTPYPTIAQTAKKYGISIATAERIAEEVSRRLSRSAVLGGSDAPIRPAARKGRAAVRASRRSKATR
jgi:hypothetical protein